MSRIEVDCVCATNEYPNFTYGKIYKVTIVDIAFKNERSIVKIIDDRGLPTARFIVRYEMRFIPLSEWRNRKLEQIGI